MLPAQARRRRQVSGVLVVERLAQASDLRRPGGILEGAVHEDRASGGAVVVANGDTALAAPPEASGGRRRPAPRWTPRGIERTAFVVAVHDAHLWRRQGIVIMVRSLFLRRTLGQNGSIAPSRRIPPRR